MSLRTICPNPSCKKQYSIPEAATGQSIRCKACGETFIASNSATVGAPSPAVPVASGDGVGTSLGRFLVRGKLGAGAFGTVYRAYDPHLDREVALKVPNAGVMADAKRVERFLREAKTAAGLRHPHIVPVFDAGQDGDTYYIASAFIDGKPLSDTIDEKGTDFPRAARIVRELAEALAYAHEEGIVHRDVKPANIMLDKQDRVHLMDFGLASRQDEASKLTNDGAVMGTPAYMSPEQAKGQKGDAQPATDQYAAGVVLYELLTGRTPFSGPPAVVLANVIAIEPDSPRKHRTYLPKDLETICLKAMAKNAEDRYEDCQHLADDLRRWLEGEPISARRLSLYERAKRWVEKEPKLAIGTGIVVVVFVVSFVLVSAFARRADNSRRQIEPALEQTKKDAATVREAETRATEALAEAQAARAEAQAARAREEKAAQERLGALGTAAEAQKKAESLTRIVGEQRKKIATLVPL